MMISSEEVCCFGLNNGIALKTWGRTLQLKPRSFGEFCAVSFSNQRAEQGYDITAKNVYTLFQPLSPNSNSRNSKKTSRYWREQS